MWGLIWFGFGWVCGLGGAILGWLAVGWYERRADRIEAQHKAERARE